jgi:hypothetical protein
MTKAHHTPYSPDLAPFDFYLFSNVKQLWAGHEFPGRGAFLDIIQDILTGIEKVALDRVFLAWMERLERCVTINANYGEETNISC